LTTVAPALRAAKLIYPNSQRFYDYYCIQDFSTKKNVDPWSWK